MDPSCPVCRAPSGQGPTCYRCKTDLSALERIRGAAASLLSQARAEYRAGSFSRALALTRGSLSLCRTEEALDLEILLLFRTGQRARSFARWKRRSADPLPSR